ncbi:MAG: Cna B-type domain-containing protein, partial [Clostridia bacterium]|nr:Cna B-type domain-containing protein [Clostridia bacterium]
ICGTKTWIDGGKDHDNASEIVLTLTREANGKTETVDATPTWSGNKYKYSDLDKYDADGYEYTYSVSEAQVDGYEAPEQDGYNFTNPITQEKIEISGTKTWIDGNKNHDNASEIKLTLSRTANGKTETVSATPVWNGNTYTYSDLDKYDADGYEYTYSVVEAAIPGYTTAQNGNDFTNTVMQEYFELTLRKVWQDADDQDGIRPDELTVTLSNGQVFTLNAGNGWSVTVSDLPKYDEDGAEIVYTWSEDEVAGYTVAAVTEGTVTTLTNTHTPETTSVTVIKVWDDADNRDGIRPDSVIAVLSNGLRVTLNEENEWRATVDDLPVYDGGEVIVYTWTEEKIPGYELTVATEGNITTLTNIHDSESVSLKVTKVWNDVADQDGLRPTELVVTLLGNGDEVGKVTLNADNRWTAVLDNLPINRDGEAIVYTWTEPEIEGYTRTGMATVDNMTIITNTHVPETIDLTVAKRWEDNGNPARPESLIMILTGGGQARPVTLSAFNNWTATVTGLPRYARGQRIIYTWTESAISGYTLTSQVTTGNSTVFTNTRNTVPTPVEHTLTVYYRYQDGRQAAPTVVEIHKEGDTYRVVSPVIPGYTASILVVAGTMPGHDVEYTVIYIPDGNPPPDNPEPGMGQVYINVGDCLE